MPVYSYTNEKTGETVERFYPAKKYPRKIRIGNKVYVKNWLADQVGVVHEPGNWPLFSDALGCGEHQVEEATRVAAENGVPTDFTKDGRAILRNKDHRKKYAKLYGFFDKDAGYGDPLPDNV